MTLVRIKSLGGYPIEQHNSPNIGGQMTGHRGVVLHIAQGTYRGTIGWQLNPDQRYSDGTRVTTSSTWVVGRQRGEWAQMVDTDRVAWCQRAGSLDWHSIELAGWAPNPPTDWQIWACAQLLALEHREYGVPVAVADHPGMRGLGHHAMDREWLGEEWGHDACPGAGVIGAKPEIVRQALAIVNGDDDMQLSDPVRLRTGQEVEYSSPTTTVEGVLTSTNYYVLQTRNRVLAELAAQRAIIEQLAAVITAGGGSVDTAAILAGVDERLAALRTQVEADTRDAVADLAEGGATAVRADG